MPALDEPELSDRERAGTAADILVLEAFLPYRLNFLATRTGAALADIYTRSHGITPPEWRVLATIGQFGRITARDIAAHSNMHKTMVMYM